MDAAGLLLVCKSARLQEQETQTCPIHPYLLLHTGFSAQRVIFCPTSARRRRPFLQCVADVDCSHCSPRTHSVRALPPAEPPRPKHLQPCRLKVHKSRQRIRWPAQPGFFDFAVGTPGGPRVSLVLAPGHGCVFPGLPPPPGTFWSPQAPLQTHRGPSGPSSSREAARPYCTGARYFSPAEHLGLLNCTRHNFGAAPDLETKP